MLKLPCRWAGLLVVWGPIAGCSDGGSVLPPGVGAETESIDAFVEECGRLGVAEEVPKTQVHCNGECPPDGQEGDSFCSYRRYTETEQLDRFVAFQPNSATLWPGSLVRGADAEHGLLTPVGVPLAPVTFSVSLENIGGSPVAHMAEPSLSAFRSERNRILSHDVTGATPASLDFEIVQVHSSSQLALALDASVSWPGGNEIAGSFDFESGSKSTKLVVNFTQAYYTVDVDTPATPADFFAEGVTVADLEAYVGKGNPPLYVQSITYGRRVIFTVETHESRETIEAALSATYNGVAKGSLDVSLEHQQAIEQSTIRAFVFGGSGSDATAIIDGVDGLTAYIQRGGDYSKDSPGAPIAYKLAYLDNAVTKMALTSDYTERDCYENRARLTSSLERIDHISGGDPGGQLELYGRVELRLPTGASGVQTCDEGGTLLELWELTDGQWVSVDEHGSWTPSSPVEASIEGVAIGPDEQLCIVAHIAEHDPIGGDDDYGTDARLIDFDDGWQGTHVLQPRGSADRAVDVHVRIELNR